MLSTEKYTYKTWGEKFPDNIVNIHDLDIDDSWQPFINSQKDGLDKINKSFSIILKKTKGNINIYPYPDLVFHAFNLTPLKKVKVVILGQDPYFKNEVHDDKMIPQAMGLSFSVPDGFIVPSSLKNIYKNMKDKGVIDDIPKHGNLEEWAKQGCLMINSTLTVQHGLKNSHEKYWKEFTDNLIKYISRKKKKVIFVLWGAYSLKKLELIDTDKHTVLISSHPSGLSYSKKLGKYKAFKDSNHFGDINEELKKKIKW